MKRFSCCLLCSFLLCLAGTAVAEPFVPGEALVLFRSAAGRRVSRASAERGSDSYRVRLAAASAGSRVKRVYGALSEAGDKVFALVRSESRTTEELLRALRANPDVLAASPNRVVRAVGTIPNDSDIDRLWGMRAIRAPEAWALASGDRSVYVAVIDSGIARDHEDLKDNLDIRYCQNFVAPSAGTGSAVDPVQFDDGNGHGTHVSGTIGAMGNNGLGVCGVGWRVGLIGLRVLDADGAGSVDASIQALDTMIRLLGDNPSMKIAAVNLSLGGYSDETPEGMANRDVEWFAYKTLSDMNRAVIVVAAGNEGLEVGRPAPFDDPHSRFRRGQYAYPASFIGIDNMIVVGAVDEDCNAAPFSNWSEARVDVAAPGVGIFSTTPEGVQDGLGGSYEKYGIMSGTSMAAPHVAGAAALLLSKYPEASARRLKEALLGGSDGRINPIPEPFKNKGPWQDINDDMQKLSVRGLLDVRGALDWMQKGGANPSIPTPRPEPTPPSRPKEPEPDVQPNPAPDERPIPKPAPRPNPQPQPRPELPASDDIPVSLKPGDWTVAMGEASGGAVPVEITTPFSASGKTPGPSDRVAVVLRGFGDTTAEILRGGGRASVPVEVERSAASHAHGTAGTLRIVGKVAPDRMKEAAVERLTYTLEGHVFRVDLRASGNASGIPLREMTRKKEETRSSKGTSGGCDSGWGLLGLSLFLSVATGQNGGKRGR